jgi:hypothetical protein
MSVKLRCLAVMLVAVASTAAQASDPFVTTFMPSGNDVSNATPGQSLTTPAGGPWDNLGFHWFGETDPSAFGQVFLLDQEYLGEPVNLRSTTPGFIASAAAGASQEEYDFDPSVRLQPSTQYYVYANAAPAEGLRLSLSDEYPEGMAYEASSPFASEPSADWGFGLSGVVVPEPSTFAIVVIGLLGLAFYEWRRRR